jgi:single-strand DNA-binding protein
MNELKGRLTEDFGTVQVSDKFQKREFVIEVPGQYPDFIKCELKQDKTNLLDGILPGTELTVLYNIRGRKWEKDGKVSYFVSIEAWKIVAGDAVYHAPVSTGNTVTVPTDQDQLPF